ncbi:type II toxin-antitoxin system death-on-curing family toxin [Desulfatirhabdium butyrativorans]|uniref:type II toxin-antitoxin system death-on-curing family toxin n=1 Tax=Desulfatirhabdium butyrativorans TaxID=340467 RepID=UPI0005519611|nr:type II toxin-antitoxin system death-on-curing family toxin [Desulfatirhabdium butyrativorans]
MRYISLRQVLEIHRRVIEQSGGSPGILNLGALESAIHQPRMIFGGHELYPTLAEKASALAFSIIGNHPFIDGNKRTGHAVMEVFVIMNGYEIWASVDDSEKVILRVASGKMGREEFTDWIEAHQHPLK